MDTSPEYVKMCDCPEIQGAHVWELGDVFAAECTHWVVGDARFRFVDDGVPRRVDEPIAVVSVVPPQEAEHITGPKVWLPTQSQLQEMVGVAYPCECFNRLGWWYDYSVKPLAAYGSMEQLWLAFVMDEKGKTWDGETWRDNDRGI